VAAIDEVFIGSLYDQTSATTGGPPPPCFKGAGSSQARLWVLPAHPHGRRDAAGGGPTRAIFGGRRRPQWNCPAVFGSAWATGPRVDDNTTVFSTSTGNFNTTASANGAQVYLGPAPKTGPAVCPSGPHPHPGGNLEIAAPRSMPLAADLYANLNFDQIEGFG